MLNLYTYNNVSDHFVQSLYFIYLMHRTTLYIIPITTKKVSPSHFVHFTFGKNPNILM